MPSDALCSNTENPMTSEDLEQCGWFALNFIGLVVIEAMEYKKTIAFLACVIIAFVYWLIAY